MKNTKTYSFNSGKYKIGFIFVVVVLFVCGFMAGGMINEFRNHKTHKDSEMTNCQKIEHIFESTKINHDCIDDYRCYENNVNAYRQLIEYGCPENKDLYNKRIADSLRIMDALEINSNSKIRACEQSENILLQDLSGCYSYGMCLRDADIYAQLVEYGCPEHQSDFKQKAKYSLDVAESLMHKDDSSEVREMVGVYKKLQMQQEAKKFLDKADRLIGPATDFIYEMERLINE